MAAIANVWHADKLPSHNAHGRGDTKEPARCDGHEAGFISPNAMYRGKGSASVFSYDARAGCRQQRRTAQAVNCAAANCVYLRSVYPISVMPVGVSQREYVYLDPLTQFTDHIDEHGNTPIRGVGAESGYDQPDLHDRDGR